MCDIFIMCLVLFLFVTCLGLNFNVMAAAAAEEAATMAAAAVAEAAVAAVAEDGGGGGGGRGDVDGRAGRRRWSLWV
jgi:hypothetical protein